MALLVSAQSLKKSFGAKPLFEGVSLTVNDGDRLGLIGPNGAGKSTFLQILAGKMDVDSGEVSLRKNARLAYVTQESAFPAGVTVSQVLEAKMPGDEYEYERQIILSRVGFVDNDAPVETLSGGWRKRLAIAEALATDPELLMLDEPTNHLDLAGILWLEKLLTGARFASVVITHDRYFLENVATHVAELAPSYPGGLFLVKGNYGEFLERKADFLIAQESQRDALASRVRSEVEWLRRGPKARTTKAKARIDTAHEFIGELAEVTARQRTAQRVGIDFTASERRTKRLVEAENLGGEVGGKRLFSGIEFVLGPGVRLGLVGPNGSGKTTLMRILMGDLAPAEGTMKQADLLKIVYFAQNRAEKLDPALPLRRALCPHGDSVMYQGRPIHVAPWAKRFSFPVEQLDQPVGRLSGGEKARVHIARLMLESADLLLLDEPTNDLDIPTLETLEESLLEFPGAVVLVTHDRYMLDRVSTRVLGLYGDGTAGIFADYSQWEQSQPTPKELAAKAKLAAAQAAAEPAKVEAPKKKLSYKDQREWDGMEARILEAETAVDARRAAMEAAATSGDAAALAHVFTDLAEAEKARDTLYERWQELEAKQ